MDTVSGKYREKILEMIKLSRQSHAVDEHNVFQPGNRAILPYIDQMVGELLLEGSRIAHFERLEELFAEARSGKACLILSEHYSNFDLPCIHYLARKASPTGAEIADALIAIAGIKLNEANPAVLAFTEAFTRIVIYPSRALEIIKSKIKEPKDMVGEALKSATINRAAMRALKKHQNEGHLVLVFPAGTRYRPWEPETKRGVREIDSYLKSFDKMVLLSINGNILRINPDGEMMEDVIVRDKVVIDCSPVIDCAEFRESVKDEAGFRDDKKQMIVDEVMRRLDDMHAENEKS